MKRKAFVTGITGQDGGTLAEFLLEKDYEVFGLKRRTSTVSTSRINHLLSRIEIVEGDLLDTGSLSRAISAIRPDEIYNLAAQSFVKTSFDQPVLTGEITGMGVVRLLEAIRNHAPNTKFYQASTSEMLGKCPPPQNEKTHFYPRSPYGVAKLYAHWMTINAREQGLFACCGILFNHEGPYRGSEFVTQKIAQGAAAIKLGYADHLTLGNLDAMRDWGHAKDFVKAMWLMLQQEQPDDYVVATGIAHSVREFAQTAFSRLGLDYQKYVRIDPALYRPTEVDYLLGDATKAKEKLGWQPKITFEELVNEMVDYAMAHPEEWEKRR